MIHFNYKDLNVKYKILKLRKSPNVTIANSKTVFVQNLNTIVITYVFIVIMPTFGIPVKKNRHVITVHLSYLRDVKQGLLNMKESMLQLKFLNLVKLIYPVAEEVIYCRDIEVLPV